MSMGNILIVEDADLVREALRTRLEKEGYQLGTARTVNEALDALRTRMPDLIILDLTVIDEDDPLSGVSDGFVVMRFLRLNYPEANPGVIIYTVNNSPQVESRAKAMGAWGVIEKTSGIQSLLRAVREALEQRNIRPPAPAATGPITPPAIA
jgi:CheY-like chemotaxis protein